MYPPEPHNRVVIEGISPEIDQGLYPAKGIVGEFLAVAADIYADGHDELSAVLLWKQEMAGSWNETPMELLINDRWCGGFRLESPGNYLFSITAWIDRFKTWRRDLIRRLDAEQDVGADRIIGSTLIRSAAELADKKSRQLLIGFAERISSTASEPDLKSTALATDLCDLMFRFAPRENSVSFPKELLIMAEPVRARFSSWYEVFPRSCSPDPGGIGTIKDLQNHLPYIAAMGFDTLYLPPVHPIGVTHRKGKNNSLECKPDDPGSPWAVGNQNGGHKAIDPKLGNLNDFKELMLAARKYGIEIALDVSLQVSPNHPYVKEHPDWFMKRPDGSIQYAENPPKKYQDIYPFNFKSPAWEALWKELKSIFEFWMDQGVKIFRVDNPHTKPFKFWEWCLKELKAKDPEVILLSEAFTRPKIMYHLAKMGFTQSYTYFPWRVNKWELTQYFTELNQPPICHFFHPSHWTNTPDILIAYLQSGGRPAFIVRLILAATLGANYGVYGPTFELCENKPLLEDSEEYLDSEKYQIRNWDLNQSHSLKDVIARVNRIRRENPALQSDGSLNFCQIENDQIIAYTKHSKDQRNIILTIVNLDPNRTQSGSVRLPLWELGIDGSHAYQVHDLLSDAKFLWNGEWNCVELNPQVMPAHIFKIKRFVRREQEIDYYE